MPLVGAAVKAKFKKTIFDGLKAAFGGPNAPKDAEESWMKIAEAVSGIGVDIVSELQTNAQIAPGIPIAGVGGGVPGPVSGATTGPGKII